MTYNSIESFVQALENLKVTLPSMVVANTKIGVMELAVDIKNRVSKGGKTQDNGLFSSYSKKYGAVKAKKGKDGLGKQSSFKNFYLTGDMWSSFGMKKIGLQGDVINSEINFSGQNVYKSNQELDEIHSQKEFGSADTKKGIGYPSEAEEIKLVKSIELAIYIAITKAL